METFTTLAFPIQLALAALAGLLLTGVAVCLPLSLRCSAQARQQRQMVAELTDTQQLLQQHQQQLTQAQEHVNELQQQRVQTSTQLEMVTQRSQQLEAHERQTAQELQRLRTRNAQMETQLEEEQKRAAEKLEVLNTAREQLTQQFKLLANEILEEKSSRFTEQNKLNLETVLKPLSSQIKDFQKRVEETYDRESKDRFSLVKEIKNLQQLNSRISEDAVNLTNALKGESKTQGTWGELKLERILEASGLVRGREYDLQVNLKNEAGSRLQPDVVVHLPENKEVIIDSKVTLTAYHRYMSTTDEVGRQQQAQLHLQALQNHIKALGNKDYQNLVGVRTLDFVLMFLPVEEAFNLAVQRDPELFSKALEKNIILVGPSTLLATLRTIQHIWRNEYQTQNAQEIARKAGGLYDKFVNFVADLEEVGQRLEKAQGAYEKAHNKLTSGRGNLINRAQALQHLGAKTSKVFAQQLLEKGAENSEREEPGAAAEQPE